MVILDNKDLKKKYVYSLRLTTEQHKLLKLNPGIKKDLDRFIIQYLNSFLENKKG